MLKHFGHSDHGERHTSSVYLICSLISHLLNSLSMSCIHPHPGIFDQELCLNSLSSPNGLTDYSVIILN